MHKFNFEKSLQRLEEITQKLESQDFSLDESLKLFEEGINLSRICEKSLSDAEKKLEILKSVDIDDYSEEELAEEKLEKKNKSELKQKKTDDKDGKVSQNTDDGVNKETFLF